jgi:hypothetical protein
MSEWKEQRGIGKNRNSPHIVAKRYTVPAVVVDEIKKAAPNYGSQGRALQVATEMLIRMERPPEPDQLTPELTRMTFRIHKRTAQLIDLLSKLKYNNDRGQVFTACVKVLKMKRIKI